MGTDSQFERMRLLDPANARLDGQQRVNAEIFTAMEILGRKLERVEDERDKLARRLALFESAASVDKKTGKLYLPVTMDPSQVKRFHDPSKWIAATSLMSTAVALFALCLVLFQEPAQSLTKEQIAVLDRMNMQQFKLSTIQEDAWKNPADETAQLPSVAELAEQEQKAAPLVMPSSPLVAPIPVVPPKVAEERVPEPVAVVPPVEVVAKEELAPPPAPVVAPKPVVAEKPKRRGDDVAVATPAVVKPKSVVVPIPSTPLPPADVPVGEMASDKTLPEKLAQLETRAFSGVPEAQHDMATLYASGKVVAQDYRRAIYWFTRSADGGVANANYNLGVIYQQGLGVRADMNKAIGWYEKAAELGHPEAMYNLGIAFIEGIGTKANITKGVSYFKRAAQAGVAQAAYNLGVLYESNFVGPADTSKALEWYHMAANAGHGDARAAVARLDTKADQNLTLADIGGASEPVASDGQKLVVGPDNRARAPQFHTELLARVQEELLRQGLLSGNADGIMTPQTEDAIRAVERKLSMREDGQPSQELLDKLLQAGR